MTTAPTVRPPRPEPLEVLPDHVPVELKALDQWVAWRWTWSDKRGKWDKPPLNVRTGRLASSTKSDSWVSFDAALTAHQEPTNEYSGIGFVFTADDPFVGIDLDHCRDSQTGEILPWTAEQRSNRRWHAPPEPQHIIEALDSYAEVSPSGTGVKMIVTGQIPKSGKAGDFEMYDCGRYFTITGHKLPSVSDTARPAELHDLYEAFMRGDAANGRSNRLAQSADDQSILSRCFAAANGGKIQRLFDGDTSGHPSASEADLALCSMLAFWTGPDTQRIDSIFRQSGLMREKWDEKHSGNGATYGAMTIETALSSASNFYDWHKTEADEKKAKRVADAEKTLEGIEGKEPEAVFSEETIRGLATLYLYNPTQYANRKAALKGVVNLNDLQRAVKQAAETIKRECRSQTEERCAYRMTRHGLVWDKNLGEGTVPVALTNFVARISGETTEDDGSETRRVFQIEAKLRGQTFIFSIPAERFPSLNWVSDQLGAEAIVFAGSSLKDHTRVAIQSLSDNIDHQVVFKHTGWRKIDDAFVYLHAGGSIGPLGPLSTTTVQLDGEHTFYELPEPPTGERLQRRILQFLELRKLSKRTATCCLEGAVFRAPLGDCDSTLWITGRTGQGKSELVARYQQAFGTRFHGKALPGSWASTGNALEVAAHAAKDALFVIDDFCPRGTSADQHRYHQLADRVIRAQRNKAGRQRLWADGRLRPTKHPRGIIVGTGEDIPNGHSLRASMLIIELADFDFDMLTECQRFGQDGAYAEVMSAYIQWLAGRYESIQRRLRQEIAELRDEAAGSTDHRRTPELVANLALGVRYFLNFAQDIGALSDEAAHSHYDEAWRAIGEAAVAQQEYLSASEPERRFVELLHSALASGEAHVANGAGAAPQDDPVAWGWRTPQSGHGWEPQGKRIGWLEDEELYLDPEASFKAAQEMARHTESIAVGQTTLHKRLHEAGYLATIEGKHLQVRRTLERRRRRVLHISKGVWDQKVVQVVQPDQRPP